MVLLYKRQTNNADSHPCLFALREIGNSHILNLQLAGAICGLANNVEGSLSHSSQWPPDPSLASLVLSLTKHEAAATSVLFLLTWLRSRQLFGM